MTRLLVSVRDASEALAALEGGADLIDVKEPTRCPPGAASLRTIAEVVAAVAGRAPISAALGELSALDRPAVVPPGLRFAKLGLAGCADLPNWPRLWERALAELPPGTTAVAVAYADWQDAGSPPPTEVLAAAGRVRAGAFLIDTFAKDGRTIFDHLDAGGLAELLRTACQQGLMTVLAGSLDLPTLPAAVACRPDCVAFRGAACLGGREGTIAAECVRRLAAALRTPALELPEASRR